MTNLYVAFGAFTIGFVLGGYSAYKYGVRVGIILAKQNFQHFMENLSVMDSSYISMLIRKHNEAAQAAKTEPKKPSLTVLK